MEPALGLVVAMAAEARALVGSFGWTRAGGLPVRRARLPGGTRLLCARSGVGGGRARTAVDWLAAEGAAALAVVEPDVTAHRLHHALADRETEAGAAFLARERRIGLREAAEDPVAKLLRDAGAAIADRHARHVGVEARRDVDRPALGREFRGVGDEVRHGLLHPLRIPHPVHLLGRLELQHPLGVRLARLLDAPAHQLAQLRRLAAFDY